MSVEIELESGKYKIIHQDEGEFRAYRNGLAWRELAGDKLVLALVYRIKGLQKNLGEANQRNRGTHRYHANMTAAITGLMANPDALTMSAESLVNVAHETALAMERKISEFDPGSGS